MGVAGSRPLRRRLHNSCQTKWGGGHCCEANVSAMCLIRLCGIKSRIPGTRINTDRQTDGQTGRDTSGLVAGTAPVVCPHCLCPDQTFKALLSLAVIFFFSYTFYFKWGLVAYLVSRSRTKPTTSRAGAKRWPAFFLSDENNKSVETAESERKSSDLLERVAVGRGGGRGGQDCCHCQ